MVGECPDEAAQPVSERDTEWYLTCDSVPRADDADPNSHDEPLTRRRCCDAGLL